MCIRDSPTEYFYIITYTTITIILSVSLIYCHLRRHNLHYQRIIIYNPHQSNLTNTYYKTPMMQFVDRAKQILSFNSTAWHLSVSLSLYLSLWGDVYKRQVCVCVFWKPFSKSFISPYMSLDCLGNDCNLFSFPLLLGTL